MSKYTFKMGMAVLVAVFGMACARAEEITIKPEQAEIVLPSKANMVARAAADELQLHIRLMTGRTLPKVAAATEGKYAFSFPGVPDGAELKPEQAHYEISAKGTVFYGFDDRRFSSTSQKNDFVFCRREAAGTLTAVYDFLENCFGIRWLWPGETGIVYPTLSTLALPEGAHDWTPELIMREIRPGYSGKLDAAAIEKNNLQYPRQLAMTAREMRDRQVETCTWLRRMRMGVSYRPSFGHAFTNWWQKYQKDHPDFFAMQKDGERSLAFYHRKAPERCKLCVSNPDVVKMVVKIWADAGKPDSINTCENDSAGYCRCPNCLALDVPLPGEEPLAHLTDRYIHFTNAVRREAAKLKPDVVATVYAYGPYVEPPRREKVDDNVLIGMVPSMMADFEKTEKRYAEWNAAGARTIFLRPNDQHINPGIPMGFEKRLYDHFQIGYRHGIIGTDYDTLHNFWQANGVADYILARAIANPKRSFEELMDEYCNAFGEAAADVKAYFQYWRVDVFEQRLMANAQAIREKGRYGNFRRGVMWDLPKYYHQEDFDRTDAMLASASSRKLTPPQRRLVDMLKLGNKHARLVFEAVCARGEQKLKHGMDLLKFRSENKNKLQFNWQFLMKIEYEFGDLCGIKEVRMLTDFSDFARTPAMWAFTTDKDGVGDKENWPARRVAELQKRWNDRRISVNEPWEEQNPKTVGKELAAELKAYDGVGWYAQKIRVNPQWKDRKVFLIFGAVDESIWLWVNGKAAGERIYTGGREWMDPVVLDITDCIDWNRGGQSVVAKVQDTGGQGGIMRNIYLVTK